MPFEASELLSLRRRASHSLVTQFIAGATAAAKSCQVARGGRISSPCKTRGSGKSPSSSSCCHVVLALRLVLQGGPQYPRTRSGFYLFSSDEEWCVTAPSCVALKMLDDRLMMFEGRAAISFPFQSLVYARLHIYAVASAESPVPYAE